MSNPSSRFPSFHLVVAWFRSSEWKLAGFLLAILVALNLVIVWLLVRLNDWQRDFWNSLEQRDSTVFLPLIAQFTMLAFAWIFCTVWKQWFSQLMEIRWRRWLVTDLLALWLQPGVLWKASSRVENPDQRVTDDTRAFANLTISLFMGLLESVVTLGSFAGILWGLSGAFDLAPYGLGAREIPGYMLWLAILWALFGSFGASWLGRPLRKLNFNQQMFEANFRNDLVRVKERREPISLLVGEVAEASRSRARFGFVEGNWRLLMVALKRQTWFSAGYGQAAVIFPILCVAPRLFAGTIKLGDVMQISGAFGKVADSLSWLVTSYPTVAEWRACADRLLAMRLGCQQALTTSGAVRTPSTAGMRAKIDIQAPTGESLLSGFAIDLAKGERVGIAGPSGCGKSLALKSLAGLWEHATGEVAVPEGSFMWLPQDPWLPEGTLREAICYPHAVSTDSVIEAALTAAGCPALGDRLDEIGDWGKSLSRGMRQKVAVAKALLVKPDWLFLDEATSSMDDASELVAITSLFAQLPEAGIVCVAHRQAALAACGRTLII